MAILNDSFDSFILSTEKLLEDKINREIDTEIKTLENQLKIILPTIQIQVRQEIFQSFKLITGIVIEQEFVKAFGHNFDLRSLQNSLIYLTNPKDLIPTISYNPSIFRFNDKMYREKNKFNQNARKWERKNRKYLDPSFYTDTGTYADLYDDPFFEDYVDLTSDGDLEYGDLLLDYEEITFNNKRNPTEKIDINSTYRKAIQKAKQGFNKEWQRTLKNRIEKKYNIRIKTT